MIFQYYNLQHVKSPVPFTSILITHHCTLWALMLNKIAYAYPIKCLSFEGQFNEVSRND